MGEACAVGRWHAWVAGGKDACIIGWRGPAGPERERDIGALDDGPDDTGARAFGPCGLSAGVTGGWSDEEELRSHVGTGTESLFGPT